MRLLDRKITRSAWQLLKEYICTVLNCQVFLLKPTAIYEPFFMLQATDNKHKAGIIHVKSSATENYVR